MPAQRSNLTEVIATKDLPAKKLDTQIEAMARARMSEVVLISEGLPPRLRFPTTYAQRAGEYLVARMFTDAVFNQDIRSIQTIINRIDGGLPKDIEVESYSTQFGDCLAEIMEMDDPERIKVFPDDTVMMALCKSLYQMATTNVYWDPVKKRPKKPTVEQKNERDLALRLILDRVGGRKTKTEQHKEPEKIGVADWIKGGLPDKTGA